MKKLFALALLAAISLGVSYAQTTAVSATVVDSDSTAWANGTWNIAWTPGPSNPDINAYTVNGSPLSGTVAFQNGTMDGSGAMSVTVYDSSLTSPTGSGYALTLCSKTSAPCSVYNFQTASASQDISAALTASIKAPRFSAVSGSYGYNDTEAALQVVAGATYFNVTSNTQRCYTGSAWGACSSGGGTGISGATAGQALIAGSATTATSSKALAGAGAGLTTGPTSATLNDCVKFNADGSVSDAGAGCGGTGLPAGCVASGTTGIICTGKLGSFPTYAVLPTGSVIYGDGSSDERGAQLSGAALTNGGLTGNWIWQISQSTWGNGATYYNDGCDGGTSTQLLARYTTGNTTCTAGITVPSPHSVSPSVTSSTTPHYFIIGMSVFLNDAINSISTATSISNVNSEISTAVADGWIVVLETNYTINSGSINATLQQQLLTLNQDCRNGTITGFNLLIDNENAIPNTADSALFIGGLGGHPTLQGHTIVANSALSVLSGQGQWIDGSSPGYFQSNVTAASGLQAGTSNFPATSTFYGPLSAACATCTLTLGGSSITASSASLALGGLVTNSFSTAVANTQHLLSYNSGMTAAQSNFLSFGQGTGANNSLSLGFVWQGAGSASNSASFGLSAGVTCTLIASTGWTCPFLATTSAGSVSAGTAGFTTTGGVASTGTSGISGAGPITTSFSTAGGNVIALSTLDTGLTNGQNVLQVLGLASGLNNSLNVIFNNVAGSGSASNTASFGIAGHAGCVLNTSGLWSCTNLAATGVTASTALLATNGSQQIIGATTTGTGSTAVLSASPALTGTPTAPTAAVGTNTTQLATTAFVANGFSPTISTPTGTPTYTAGTNVTSCGCASGYTCTNQRGELTIVGGTATTGTICTLNFSATLSAAPGYAETVQNGGAVLFGIGHGTPGTASMTVTAGISVSAATVTVDYNFLP